MTPRPSPRHVVGLVALGLLPLAGCGGPNMAPVTGTVRYEDGQPVTVGGVILSPAGDPNLPSATGDIRPDGTFTLSTAKPGDGAVVGRYHVLVVPPGDDYGPKNPRPIDPRFGDPKTSGIEFEVKPGPNTLPVTVHRPKR